MKPEDDPWVKNAHANAELLEQEIKKLVLFTNPIRENRPIVTKYQDFWNRAKKITGLFKELKPLAKSDRELLWKQFNALCLEVKEKQKTEYGTLESLSQKHLDEILKLAGQAELPSGASPAGIHDLVERGQALKNASDQLARFKHAMIAKHKKACFDRIQGIRKTHDAAWALVKEGKPKERSEISFRARMNLSANYQRCKKAQAAVENFRISRDHIRTFLATSKDPLKICPGKNKACTDRSPDPGHRGRYPEARTMDCRR